MLSTSRSFASKLLVALVAAGALALGASMLAPAQAHAARAYGLLCSKYESGNDPSEVDQGAAYGAYQMSPGNAHTYATWLKEGAGYKENSDKYKTCVKMGKKLVKAYKKDGESTGSKFTSAWKACNTLDTTLFFNTQYSYCKTHYYDEAVKYWKMVASGFDPDDYSVALRCALFSTAIQHGPYGSAYYILKNALKDVGGWKKGMGEDVLINAIYYERSAVVKTAPKSGAIKMTGTVAKKYGINGKYLLHFYSNSSAVQVGVYNRLHNNERKEALSLMLKKGVKCTHGYTKGGKKTYTSSKATETTHYVVTSAVYCTTCGKKIKSKKTQKYVKHSFTKYSGANIKCACGAKFMTSSAAKYYVTGASTVLRTQAKASAKQNGQVLKGLVVKPSKIKVGSDHNYWAKLSVGNITGWTRLSSLSVHGNGGKGHVFVDGVCKYCKASEAVTKNTVASTYKALQKTTFFKAAYAASKKGSVVKKNKKVKVIKVVRNAYGNLWGKTKAGGYIDLSLFKNTKATANNDASNSGTDGEAVTLAALVTLGKDAVDQQLSANAQLEQELEVLR